jgi:peroxiredoxin
MNVPQLALFSFLTLTAITQAAPESVKQAPRVVNPPSELGVGRQIPDLAFTDWNNHPHKLSDFKLSRGVAIAFTSTSCPLCKKYAPTLAYLERTFQDVTWIFVNPIATDSADDIKAMIATQGLKGLYFHDKDGTFAKAIGAHVTTEVFLLDPKRTIVYRGAIDDQHGLGYSKEKAQNIYLYLAIEALLAKKTPTIAATIAPGCELDLESAKATTTSLTYHNQISRLVQTHCMECHRKEGVAPFSLESYEDLKAHAGMIRKVVEKQTMPPWFASNPEGKPSPWFNDRTMPKKDRDDLLAWLASKREVGDQVDAPLAKKFPAGWRIGQPDLILELPKRVAVKATGVMPYQNIFIDLPSDEDQWVQKIEVKPTAREVVHHVLVYLAQKGKKPTDAIDERTGFLGVYVPGNSTLIYPEGMAKRIPKGSRLLCQLHYTPNGTAIEDQTQIGIVFAKKPPEHEIYVGGIANTKISIPPGADNHLETAIMPVPFDAKILGFLPHLHMRGKAFKYEYIDANGKTETLLDIPHYDFNWQLLYRFQEPKFLGRGGKIRVTATYDNSDKNPANPNPNKTVRWGPQTFDEMMLGYVEFYQVK